MVADMDSTSEGFVTYSFNLGKIGETRAAWGVFRDRRPDLYSPLLTLDGVTHGANTAAVHLVKESIRQATFSCDKVSNIHVERNKKPAYYMPGEWCRHSATWMGFPACKATWCQGGQPAEECFIALARCIAEYEPVNMIVPGEHYSRAVSLLGGCGGSGGDGTRHGVRLVEMLSNDGAWLRDQAPCFVLDRGGSGVAGVCWKFDAWGRACYEDFTQDALIRSPLFAPLLISLS